jgi:hypothetical protein
MILALLLLFAPGVFAADNADPGGSSMDSLIMGSWKQAEHEGHKDFCFTGLAVSMNEYRHAAFGGTDKEIEAMSGYYNAVTTYFMTPKLPLFSVTVYEPNGKGPTDPTFPLYNYMLHIDGDGTIGHRDCIGKLEVDYPRAVGIAAKMGLITATGNSQYLELRMASGPDEPGWSEKKLRGKTYWMMGESVKGVFHEYYIDAMTGKALIPRTTRAKEAPTTQDLKPAAAKAKGIDAPPAK